MKYQPISLRNSLFHEKIVNFLLKIEKLLTELYFKQEVYFSNVFTVQNLKITKEKANILQHDLNFLSHNRQRFLSDKSCCKMFPFFKAILKMLITKKAVSKCNYKVKNSIWFCLYLCNFLVILVNVMSGIQIGKCSCYC